MGVRRAVVSGNPYHDPTNGRFTNKPGSGGSADTYGYVALGRTLREASSSSASTPVKKQSGGRHRKTSGGRHRAEPIPFSQKATDFGKERLSDGFDFLYNASSAPIPGLTA
jgi:hypothetical protein